MTRIFAVEYEYTPAYDGKTENTLEYQTKVVAADAAHAIEVAEKKTRKPYSFFDDEKKKRVSVTCKTFKALSVNLLAEA